MKRIRLFSLMLMLPGLLFLNSCNNATTVINGNWAPIPDFQGTARQGAFSFVVGDRAYVGLGYDAATINGYSLSIHTYSLSDGFWKQKNDFPGVARENMVAFAYNGKGYIGGGYNRNFTPDQAQLKDFWEYDPTADSWTQIADFPYKIQAGVAFTIPEGAFVGTGYDGGNPHNEFYKYDAGNDAWIQVGAVFRKRRGAMSMVINGKAYVFGGDSNGTVYPDFYSFDPATNKWTSVAQLPANANYADFTTGVRRSNGCAFTLNDMGYIAVGALSGSAANNVVYQYDPLTDTWTRMTAFEGSARQYAVSFVLGEAAPNQHAYVGLGASGSQKFADLFEWQPLAAYDAVN